MRSIVAGQAGPDRAVTTHLWTYFFGEWMIAIYHVVILITLLNLMVSLLVRTADKVLVSLIVDGSFELFIGQRRYRMEIYSMSHVG